MWTPWQRNRRGGDGGNHLLVTYDSCRYDSYVEARTPVMDEYVTPRRAWAQGTYTYASHASMFQGMLPHAFEEEEYYNRFVRQLWRRQHRRTALQPLVGFPGDTRSIVDGFNRFGYFTCCVAAMDWFRGESLLTQDWKAFHWSGTDARAQVTWLQEQVSRRRGQPFFACVNFGETHFPYRFDDGPDTAAETPARKQFPSGIRREDWSFDERSWRAQVACVEYLDARMGDLLAFFREAGIDVTLVLCGDHGDCFGEDGLFGHGFYHPKVMEVPLGIFQFTATGARTLPALAPEEPALA